MHASRLHELALDVSLSPRVTMPERLNISKPPWRSIAARPAFITCLQRRIAMPDRSNEPMLTCDYGGPDKSDRPIR